MNFDPFLNRLCRDIRNELSNSLIKSIRDGDIRPARAVEEKYASLVIDQSIKDYIESRITRYQTVISQIQAANIRLGETYSIALLLWDQGLFFETHEWLEEKWLTAQGREKKIFQTLIWAAGTYVLLEYGRNAGARKTASKAVAALVKYQKFIPGFINTDLLISKLKAFDPVPPKLGADRFETKEL